RPVVSMITRVKSMMSPLRRLTNRSRSVSCRSPRSTQHRQPLLSSIICSDETSTRSLSIACSPNSLTMTATRFMSGRFSSLLISVVLPLPRNPVTTLTGNFPESASSIALRLRSDVHLEDVEAAGETVHRVDQAVLVHPDVVDLDRALRRQLGGARHVVGHFLRLVGV